MATRRLFRCRWVLAAGVIGVLIPAVGELAAQNAGAVAGKVTLGNGGEGVPGVRVRIPGVQLESMTDIQGIFLFESVPAGAHEIQAEVVGCRSGSWTVRVPPWPAVLPLKLDGPAVARLRELVAAGTAAAVSEAELPFTVHRLERSDVNHTSARTLADLIRGRFPGIKVVQGSGQPGERVSIQFRGTRSISGSRAPLIVVDGLITEGGVVDIDRLDIERIEILKGSAAAAIYGARGEAGVIEITTTRAAPDTAPRCYFSRTSI
ncbi:MAG: TonB-dependent receptor plug domain-containing protein [Gemmatimonadetes bacterium]|nr:TonB-dependent receptor plug domain-containing protein [Gemmatimonadota bacterium]